MKPLRAEWAMSLRDCPLTARSMRMWVPTSSKSHMSPGVYWKYQFILPVWGSHETKLLVNRLSPGRIHHRHWVADAPQGLVGVRIISAGDPHGTATGLPRIGLVFPGLAAGLTGRRNGVFAPQELAGRCVERGHPVARAGVASRGPNNDLVFDGQRCARDRDLLRIGYVRFPYDFARDLIGRNNAGRRTRGRNDKITPQGGAAVCDLPLLLWLHAPDDAAGIARGRVDLVKYAPGIRDVEEAVFGKRRCLDEFPAAATGKGYRIGEPEALDVVLVDLDKWGEALAVVGAMVH